MTLSVDDIVLANLLEHLSATPVATGLVTGASVYRIPVDDTALLFQVGQPAQRPPDLERQARIERVQQAIQEAIERAESGQISLEDAGLTAEEYASYEADLAEERRPPVEAPAGLAAAVAAARAAGLLTPVPHGDQDPAHFVHRWTAGAIAALHPGATRQAHRRAAAFWRWRVDTIPQSPEQYVEQLLEARYHHHAAGDTDQALAAHKIAMNRLQTWGQYGRAAELCRETLTWLTPGSLNAAASEACSRHAGPEPGGLRRRRGPVPPGPGDLRAARRPGGDGQELPPVSAYWPSNGGTTTPPRPCTAGPWTSSSGSATRRAWPGAMVSSVAWPGTGGTTTPPRPCTARPWTPSRALGDQAGMATAYYQLGVLAQLRENYDAAEALYRRTLEIDERRGDQAGISTDYHQLGILTQMREDYDAAEALYRRSLEIKERLGDQAGISTDYHQLGMLAQQREDYDAAEPLYLRSLEIKERLGDQAGIATSCSALGSLSEAVGNLDEAVAYRVRALAIRLRIGIATTGQLQALAGLRRRLGSDRFRAAALASGLDEESAGNLIEMLDQQEKTTGD